MTFLTFLEDRVALACWVVCQVSARSGFRLPVWFSWHIAARLWVRYGDRRMRESQVLREEKK